MMTRRHSIASLAVCGWALLALRALPAQTPAPCPTAALQAPAGSPQSVLPRTFAGPPTSAAISACDLMTRLYRFADDSMGGRKIGTPDHERATAMIAAEAKRLGLQPAGDNGTYFQALPLVSRALDTSSTIVAGRTTLRAGTDFLASTTAARLTDFAGWTLVYGGSLLDTTITLFSVPPSGTLVYFRPIAPGVDGSAIQKTAKGKAWVAWYNAIRHRATGNTPQLPAAAVRTALNPTALILPADQGATLSLTLTTPAAQALFGGSLDGLAAGTPAKSFTLTLRYVDTPRLDRNVVAVLPGSDPARRAQYVALGAHVDHLGIFRSAVDHDSVRATHLGARSGAEGAASRRQVTDDDEYDRIKVLTDSLHTLRPVRRDSIYNGADDGGSGTVALLEIAETLAPKTNRPKRSVLFVWHTGTETAPTLSGSSWFLEHPTVPRDSIVAQLNVDMIGHGEATDEVGITADEDPRFGHPDFVEVIGSRRRSTELSTLITRANTGATPLRLDYAADAPGHPEGLFCRNDQASYARVGIPVAFFTTGYHVDFRELTDEPQYLRYGHMARIVQLVAATTQSLANLDHRPSLDLPAPDPKAACKP
ncbi:MAG: M28 family peptidase [Gemmatimonadaceae bacterium]